MLILSGNLKKFQLSPSNLGSFIHKPPKPFYLEATNLHFMDIWGHSAEPEHSLGRGIRSHHCKGFLNHPHLPTALKPPLNKFEN